jgi:N-acetyl-gamma-glutamylphosphate reductase
MCPLPAKCVLSSEAVAVSGTFPTATLVGAEPLEEEAAVDVDIAWAPAASTVLLPHHMPDTRIEHRSP